MKICTTCGQEWPDEQKFCPNDGSGLRSAGKTADMVGSIIAERYHITKKLGEGGMGAVYLGEHVKMGRQSAIKVMSQSMANDTDAIARFNREAANAARINHPNVCAIYDFGETPDGVIYLAMEYIQGEVLTELIEREGALPAHRAVHIIRQAGEALQTAHDMGIVHRDLKPDNIMIAKGREGDVVKVVDFGIAKAMGPEEGQNVTKTGLVVGTPEYMSPEQLSGDKLDGRSDIYSLALVLFRMLTGDLPFQADSAQEVMIKRLTDEPSKLNAVLPEGNFPDALQQVMDRALSRMPSGRYDSAAQFAKDAEAAVAGLAVAAPTAPGDPEGATQVMDAAATVAIARTRVGAKVKTPDTPQPITSPPQPAVAKKKPNMAIAAGVVIALTAAGVGGAMKMLGGGEAAPDSALTVTGNTDTPAAANNPPTLPGAVNQPGRGNPTTNPGQQTTDPADTAVAVPPPAAIDSAAVEQRMNDLTEPLIENQALAAAAKAELETIYSNAAMPPAIRGRAARWLMQAFQIDNRLVEACRWASLALPLPMPNFQRTNLSAAQQTMGCQ